MGVSLVGQGAVVDIPQPVVINRIQPSTSVANTTVSYQTRVFVPKGAYGITVNISGTASYGASTTSGGVSFGGDYGLKYTVTAVDADTGRPGPIVSRAFATPGAHTIILAKDSFVSVGLYTNQTIMASNILFDMVLVPTKTPYTAYPTITGNRNQTAANSATSGSNSDVNWGSVVMGWDYDNNSPCLITGYNTTTRSSNWQQLGPTFQIWRFNQTTGKWTFKEWTGMSLASGSWVYGSGFLFSGDWGPQLFIKNNTIHNVVNHAIMSDGTNYHGWIKADLTVAGTTLTVNPGNTNSAFSTPVANCATVNSSFFMMYYWDRRLHKVTYAGTISNVYNGTYGANNWRSYWGQWDIATGTNDYTNINSGTADPRSAGSSSNNNLVYNTGVADAKTGFIYAIVQNGTSEYLAKWDRNGTYTGVGSFQTFLPFSTTNSSNVMAYSTSNRVDYLAPNDVMVVGANGATVEYTTGVSQPGLLIDATCALANGMPLTYGNFSIYSEDKQVLVMDSGIFVCHMAYIVGSPDISGTGRFTAPITVYRAPVTTTNLGQFIPIMGGIPSASFGRSGINNGTWQEIAMAYFARVNDNNVVDMVIAVADEFEATGAEFAANQEGPGNWIQTSFTGRVRGVFARPGYKYNPTSDEFEVAEEPFELPVVAEPVAEVTE